MVWLWMVGRGYSTIQGGLVKGHVEFISEMQFIEHQNYIMTSTKVYMMKLAHLIQLNYYFMMHILAFLKAFLHIFQCIFYL